MIILTSSEVVVADQWEKRHPEIKKMLLTFEFLENNEYLLQLEETRDCKKLNYDVYRNQIETWLMLRKRNQRCKINRKKFPQCLSFYIKNKINMNKRETASITSNPHNDQNCNSKNAIPIKDILEGRFCKGNTHLAFHFYFPVLLVTIICVSYLYCDLFIDYSNQQEYIICNFGIIGMPLKVKV